MTPDLTPLATLEAQIAACAIMLEDVADDMQREGATPYLANKALVILNVVIALKHRIGMETDREEGLREVLRAV